MTTEASPNTYTSRGLIVSDVIVSWEGPARLSTAYNNKATKYGQREVVEAIERQFPGYDRILILPFAASCRGALARENRGLIGKAPTLPTRSGRDSNTRAQGRCDML